MDWTRFREALRQGCVDPALACRLYGKDQSPPPAPDYTGAAQATAQGNVEAARYATKANRYDQFTPYGNLTWSQDATDPDKWSSTVNLNDLAKSTLDSQLDLSNQMGKLALGGTDRVSEAFAKPFDFGSVKDVEDQSYAAQTSRLDPQWQQAAQQQDAKLANQGITPGTQAYEEAMRSFNQGRNDAYTQARLAAISTQPQTYQMATAVRNQPLNELNAIRTGAQIQNPTFTPGGQQQTTAGANYLGAAQAEGQYAGNLYNQGVAQDNAMTSGLFSLGAAAAGSPWGAAAFGFGGNKGPVR